MIQSLRAFATTFPGAISHISCGACGHTLGHVPEQDYLGWYVLATEAGEYTICPTCAERHVRGEESP